MTPADAAGVVACFERGYAGTYANEDFYDAKVLAELVRFGLLRSVVAVTATGEVIGHMGLRLRTPDGATADAGNTIVDPRARGQNLAAKLGLALMQLAVETGLIGTHGYPTTAHPVIQKLEIEGGAFETGILFDYIPAETRYVGIQDADKKRIAVVVVYRPLAPTPRRVVWLPEAHRTLVATLYERIGVDRAINSADSEAPTGKSHVRSFVEVRRGLVRVTVDAAGEDLRASIAAIIGESGSKGALVDLPLSQPSVGWSCESLRQLGLYYGALLPEYADHGDVLRLQRPAGRRSRPSLATEGARALLDYIERDRQG